MMKTPYAIFTTFALITIDQVSKYIIRSSGGFYICNKNIAFSITLPDYMFWIFWLSIIFLIIAGLLRQFSSLNTLFLTLILSGAISNMIDRIIHGCIIDFIDLKFWPVFNLADVFITAGVIMLLISNLRSKISD